MFENVPPVMLDEGRGREQSAGEGALLNVTIL